MESQRAALGSCLSRPKAIMVFPIMPVRVHRAVALRQQGSARPSKLSRQDSDTSVEQPAPRLFAFVEGSYDL
jgi:hypothetical protein